MVSVHAASLPDSPQYTSVFSPALLAIAGGGAFFGASRRCAGTVLGAGALREDGHARETRGLPREEIHVKDYTDLGNRGGADRKHPIRSSKLPQTLQ